MTLFTGDELIELLVAERGLEGDAAFDALLDVAESARAFGVRFARALDEVYVFDQNDRRSVIVLCEVEEFEALYDLIGERLGIEVETPPAYVTLLLDGPNGIRVTTGNEPRGARPAAADDDGGPRSPGRAPASRPACGRSSRSSSPTTATPGSPTSRSPA